MLGLSLLDHDSRGTAGKLGTGITTGCGGGWNWGRCGTTGIGPLGRGDSSGR